MNQDSNLAVHCRNQGEGGTEQPINSRSETSEALRNVGEWIYEPARIQGSAKVGFMLRFKRVPLSSRLRNLPDNMISRE